MPKRTAINVNGRDTDLVGLFDFVSAVTANNPGPWVCKCGRIHRGKDLSCWDVGGCEQTRSEVGYDLYPIARR